MRKLFILTTAIISLATLFSCSSGPKYADLVLLNGEVYTMEAEQPWATAVAITGNKISAVLQSDDEAQAYIGPETRFINLEGKFVVPGFIDAHVHFSKAGALIEDVNLLKVSDEEGLRREVEKAVGKLSEGEWITGGMWGAYEDWALGTTQAGEKKGKRWEPDRSMIDELTPDNPCLLSSFDGELFLANKAALAAADLESARLPGMKLDSRRRPTGLIAKDSPALDQIRGVVKEKSYERLLNENRAALRKLAQSGIVEIHDISDDEQTRRFIELQENGELTCRVLLRYDLSRADELKAEGLAMGLNPKSKKPDGMLRLGGLKGYIDGIMGNHTALFFEPYDDQPENYGKYRSNTSDDPDLLVPNLEKFYNLLKEAYKDGFVANVHAIGTKGVAILLDAVERLKRETGQDLRGFRVIHAQVIRPADFPRFKALNVIAEVNPYHLSDDMRWMEERIGHERCKGAYAFKSLLDNGAMLCFGSDWPGTNAAEYFVHPKYLINAAVNRTTINGEPKGGWFPEQKISVAEALKAYTINNAYAAGEENIRGSIKVGKLADITVCDRNLLKIKPADIINMQIEMTIVDGHVVYERGR